MRQLSAFFYISLCAATGCGITPKGSTESAANASGAVTHVSKERYDKQAAPAPAGTEPLVRATFTQAESAPLSLDTVIETALASNPDLRSAGARIAVADAVLDRARAEFYPRLDLAENYGVSDNPVNAFSFQLNQARLTLDQDFNTPATIDDFHTQVLAQQTVYSGGRRGAELRAAEADLQATDRDLAALENELIFRAAEAYYRLLQARDLVQVRREAVEQVRRHLEIVQVRFRAESAVKSDVLSVEVRFAEVREALLRAENDLELAWTVLENVVGRTVEPRNLPEMVPPAPWSDAVDDVQAAVAEALQVRPEAQQIAQRREAAVQRVEAARAGYAPQVDLTADYDVYTGDFSDGNDSFFVGVVARLNLFDAGRTAGQVREACARLQELTARQDRLLLDIELQVRQAHLRLQLARQRVEVATQAVAAARESLREIEVRYRGEVATITELIDAQVALTSARGRRTAAQADLQIAQAALQQSVGRLTRYAEAPRR